VFALIHRETKEVRSFAMPKVNADNVWDVLDKETVPGSVWLRTDSSRVYKGKIANRVADHKFVDHSAGEYVGEGGVSTNLLEGFFSQLKRGLRGTHMHVSIEHLHRYLAQFDFMYSNCKKTDSERMRKLIGNVTGQRLTFRPLTSEA